MIQVSAGLIIRADGCLLVAQRAAGKSHGLQWEFPGGKREAGETAETCLIRELREELALEIRSPRVVYTAEEGGLHFDFVAAQAVNEPTCLEHAAIRWLQPGELTGLDFCPADRAVAEAIALNAPKLQACFWDFDGTLMDTYPQMVEAFLSACKAFGVLLAPTEAHDLLKHSLPHAAEKVAASHGLSAEALLAAFRRADQMPENGWPLLPGIRESLTALHAAGLRHFLVTHRDRTAWDALRLAGLAELFDGGVTREDRLPRKPAPDMLLHLLQAQRLDPKTVVMIGDRPLDIEAGLAAGVRTCLLDTEGRFPRQPAFLRCNTAVGLADRLMPEAVAWQAR